MTSSDIRNQFLEFFRGKGHHLVPSAPIVVKNDPTLMFTNAGMNQFKDLFLGNQQPTHPRIADTQKCLRVSGKHNDLEEVGVDTYHHTMFEMLGNWSFGNYFKKEAIEWSWELLTKVYSIPIDRLYVTVFEGDEGEGLPEDAEAAGEWKKWIAEDRILPGNKKDNFWEMGDTGPCGPCTEIHVDMRSDEERAEVDGKLLVNNDHPQVIEIWNNVFIQYNRLKDGQLQQLPAKHVDTGMGFERLVRVIQGKSSNYDTDVFTGTLDSISAITKKAYSGGDEKSAVAFRVLADHIRAISFTIADGQLPSNTGAGYVIRRILRRAVRYYYSYLDYKQPLLYQLVPVIAEQFGAVFPELKAGSHFVARVIREEEEAFLRTLEKGLKRIEEIVSSCTSGTVSGKEAFELYDTYGFPFDLTCLITAERSLAVDEAGFTAEMQLQKNRSRAASVSETEDWTIVHENGSNSVFVGYEELQAEAKMLRYRKVTTKGKEGYQVVLDRTPFYAESGGQVGDSGTLRADGIEIPVIDTKKENDLIIHLLEQDPTPLTGALAAVVNQDLRKKTAVHHSATHLLHAALRQVLGAHVAQKGSLVQPGSLRFDFSHFAKMSAEEIAAVERLVNEKIRANIPVMIQEMPKDEALQYGATALFGEKYGDRVRVVTIDPAYSIELCGGTHIGATGELGFFKLTSETAVAAGVRRIEALCGQAAEDHIEEQLNQLQAIKAALKGTKDPLKSLQALADETAKLKKDVERYEQAHLITLRNELVQKTEQVNGVSFIGAQVQVNGAEALKKLAAELKAGLSVLVTAVDGKSYVAIAISPEITTSKGLDAVQIIKQHVAPLIKGGGGGQKGLATAGGQDISTLHNVIQTVKGLL